MKKIELTEREYKQLQKIKLKDPYNKCHHNWFEFLMRIAKYYEKNIK